MDKKDETKSTGNPMLTLALLGSLGGVFGAPHPRSERVESKNGIQPSPKRTR